MTILRVTLPWAKTSDLSANSRLHWAKRAKLVKAQRATTHRLALAAGWHMAQIPADAVLLVTLLYCPPSGSPWPDDDNVVTASKGARDALAAVLRVDDGRFRMQAPVRGDRCKGGAVIVTVEVAA